MIQPIIHIVNRKFALTTICFHGIVLHEVISVNFSERLKQIREEKGLSQSELARMIGVGRSTICSYESGRRTKLTVPIIQAIAIALDVPWQVLVAGTDMQKQTAAAIDGHMNIKTINGKTYFNGVETATDSDPFKQAHLELLYRKAEQMDDDAVSNLAKVADEMQQLPVSAQEEIVRFSKFRRKEMQSNH